MKKPFITLIISLTPLCSIGQITLSSDFMGYEWAIFTFEEIITTDKP